MPDTCCIRLLMLLIASVFLYTGFCATGASTNIPSQTRATGTMKKAVDDAKHDIETIISRNIVAPSLHNMSGKREGVPALDTFNVSYADLLLQAHVLIVLQRPACQYLLYLYPYHNFW